MLKSTPVIRSIALACALSLSVTALGTGTIGVTPAHAQYYGSQNYYSQAQIDQLVAPVALYPDPLLAQMLAAAAYPDEIAEAYRFVSRHQDPYTLDRQNWDYSVKAVARYPEALGQLNSDLNWTAALGAAYVNQPDAVANAIQRWRAQAYSLGNLYSNAQQTVYADGQYVRIVPAQPEVIYVPIYQPRVVYVERRRPDYLTPFITFGLGLAIGAWLDKDWDWHRHRVYYGDRNRWDRGRPVFYPQFDRVYVGHEWRPETNRYRPPSRPIYPTRLDQHPVPPPPAHVRPFDRDRDGDRDANRWRDGDRGRDNERSNDGRDRFLAPNQPSNLGNQGDPTSNQPGDRDNDRRPGQVKPFSPPATPPDRKPTQVDRGPGDRGTVDRGTVDRGDGNRGSGDRGYGGPATGNPSGRQAPSFSPNQPANPPPAPRMVKPAPVQPVQPAQPVRPPEAAKPEPKPQGKPPAKQDKQDRQQDSHQFSPAPVKPQAVERVDHRPARGPQPQAQPAQAAKDQPKGKPDGGDQAERRGEGKRANGVDIN